jgi:RNA-binding motif X-linked protein 2
MNTVREINRINDKEIALGLNGSTWHDAYKSSAYIYVGGLESSLTEGDILAVFSQYGEIVDIDVVRDDLTGQSRGFCFIAYEDQRSTVLAVDNFNGVNLAGRTLRVDHKLGYFRKEKKEKEDSGNESDEEEKKPSYHPELIKALYGGPKDPVKEEERRKRREERRIRKEEEQHKRKEEKKQKKEEKNRKRSEDQEQNKKPKGPQMPSKQQERPASPQKRPLSEREQYEKIYGYK